MQTGKLKELGKFFVVTLPIWLTILSVLLIYFGFQQDVADAKQANIQKVCYTLASAMLSAGVFAAVLKSMQFMDIFEEAMEKIVLTDKSWLESLSEKKLRVMWRNVLAATVAKGFPRLSERLGDEVFDVFIPQIGEYYYSKMYRRIEIVSFDSETDILHISEEYELIINAHSKDINIPYSFKLTGAWPSLFEEIPHQITHLTINNVDHLADIKTSGIKGDSKFLVTYDISLKGSEEYAVRRNMNRKTKLSGDPILHMVGTRFIESMQINIVNKIPDVLRINPISIGIADKGLEVHTQGPHTICNVKQLMFPGDGLLLVFERV